MDKSLKMLTLFNRRTKILYLNGYTKFQILNELKDFYKIEKDDNLSMLEMSNRLFNKNEYLNLNRKIKQHFCSNIFINENIDQLFTQINDKCKNVKINSFKEYDIIDDLLDNPRIPIIEDITLASSISIYDKPFDGGKIDKKSYLDLINGILDDFDKHNKDNMLDNLLLFENAFNYLEYSISNVKDRVEIYQELTILLAKLATFYNIEDKVVLKYFELFRTKFLKDLTYENDNNFLFKIMRTVYSNVEFKYFILFFPFFVENYSSKVINEIIKDFEKDIFLKKDDNFLAIKNILIFNSSNKEAFIKNINEKKLISDIERDLSVLEFALNFEKKEQVNYYWKKLIYNNNYYLYKEALSDIEEIVKNFDRIEVFDKHIRSINKNNYDKILIEVEQLNYLNKKVYSCALNRAFNEQLDTKSFNFYFLLVLISLGLKDKATIYFYHNINYIDFNKNNPNDIFIYSNILFLINYFDFSMELLVRLVKEEDLLSTNEHSSLYSYIILELRLMKNLIIPLVNNDNIDEILDEFDIKGIV